MDDDNESIIFSVIKGVLNFVIEIALFSIRLLGDILNAVFRAF